MDVLISGAGIAGPALAYWLGRYGFRPTVVEIAPALRTGGNSVDYRGPLHLGVLAKMGGVLAEMRRAQTGGTAMRFVDEHGRTQMAWPTDLAGGDIEVQRGDLARILCEAGERTEYLFGDSITAMTETTSGVDVTFAGGRERTFDLVIGADGVHSGVRRLAFGPEERYVRHLGYHVAGWDVPNEWGWDHHQRIYNTPGRMAAIAGDRHDPARAHALVGVRVPEADVRPARRRGPAAADRRPLRRNGLGDAATAGRSFVRCRSVARPDLPRRHRPVVLRPDRAGRRRRLRRDHRRSGQRNRHRRGVRPGR